MSDGSVTCRSCGRKVPKSQTHAWGTNEWECGGGSRSAYARVVSECHAAQKVIQDAVAAKITAEKRQAQEEYDKTAPTDDTFFDVYGISLDDLSPGPAYRDAHLRFVHEPSSRTFKRCMRKYIWTETTTLV